MTKHEFLSALRVKLSKFPKKDAEERLLFYEEMIDDRIEDGLNEEAAVADIGPIDKVYSQILGEIPLHRIIKEKIRPKHRMSGGMIALVASTAIVWIPLLIATFAVILSLYAVLWSLVISVWAMFITFAIAAPASVVLSIINIIAGNTLYGVAIISAGLVLAGLAIITYYCSVYAAKGSAILTKKSIIAIKNIFVK